MSSNAEKINRIFIKKMMGSFLAQLLILALLIILVKNYINDNQLNTIANDLLIQDEYTLEKIGQYQLLNAQYALNLELYNLGNQKKLDSILFLKNTNNKTIGYTCQTLSKNYKLCKNRNSTYLGISLITVNNKTLGYIISIKKYHQYLPAPITYDLLLIFLSVIGIFIINFGLLFLPLKKRIENDTRALLNFISQSYMEDQPHTPITIEEYQTVAKKFIDEHKKISNLQIEKSYFEAQKNIAEQVAHDIRSPLTAINTVISYISTLPEQQRLLIRNATQRINDIANNLLLCSKNSLLKINAINNPHIAPELIFVVLETIVAEKNYEYSKKKILHLIINESDYHCFASINVAALKRVLSNLINNSIEATNDSGIVEISLECTADTIIIQIADNGCGVPSKVLHKITEQGFSFGKKNGNGYGLYYAQQEIEKLQGKLLINSEVNIGTLVTIQLPRIPTPLWFCTSLSIRTDAKIVILDETPFIYEELRKKLAHYPNIQLIHFSKYIDLSTLKADIYLIAYELTTTTSNGLDLIESLQINQTSYLMTNCSDEKSICSRAETMGVTILPKAYVPYVPITITQGSQGEPTNSHFVLNLEESTLINS